MRITALVLSVFVATFFTSSVHSQVTFTGGPITIVDAAAATPAVINIAGYTGTITNITVSLNGFTHTFPDDVGAVFTGPNQNALKTLLFDGPGNGAAVSNLNLTFSDSAAATLPDAANFGSGTYKPGQNEYDDVFTSPNIPAGPYATNFSAFNGTNPNGDYTLYLEDFVQGDAGTINSWQITVFGITPVPEPTTIIGASALVGFVALRVRKKFGQKKAISLSI